MTDRSNDTTVIRKHGGKTPRSGVKNFFWEQKEKVKVVNLDGSQKWAAGRGAVDASPQGLSRRNASSVSVSADFIKCNSDADVEDKKNLLCIIVMSPSTLFVLILLWSESKTAELHARTRSPPPSDLQVWLGLILYSYVRVSAWRMNYWMSKHLYVCRKCVFLSSSFKDIWYVILLCKVLILLCLKHYFKNYIHTGLAIVRSSNHFWEKVHSTFKRQKCVFKRTFLMKSLFQV